MQRPTRGGGTAVPPPTSLLIPPCSTPPPSCPCKWLLVGLSRWAGLTEGCRLCERAVALGCDEERHVHRPALQLPNVESLAQQRPRAPAVCHVEGDHRVIRCALWR